jgi:hypothetical protein
MNNNMKTKFSQNGNVELSINNCILTVTCEQINKINEIKNWYYDNTKCEYPYYVITFGSNGNKCQITEYLFGKFVELEFKDNNKFNLTNENIIINKTKHYMNDYVTSNYNVLNYEQGHISKKIIYNPAWLISNNNSGLNNELYYLMYCEKNVLIKLFETEFELLNKFNKQNNYNLTWFYINSKGESIKSRFNKTSINMVNIIKAFGKSRIIKINTLNNVNTNNKVEPNNEIAPNNEVEPDNEIENNINPEILSLKYINEQNINNIELKLKETMNIIKIKKGHFNRYGVHAGIEKNRIWKINDEGKNIYLMYCEPGELCILDKKSLNIIRKYEKDNNNGNKITWFKHSNNYILSATNLYIHQIITGCHGNGRGTMNISVDHIDRDPLNNQFDNLKIATREEQQENTKSSDGERRERKHNAKPLPDGIMNDMIKKYIVYYKECYNKEKQSYREFFKIEKHPKLDKPWIGSKSNAISIIDKLKIANDMIDSL